MVRTKVMGIIVGVAVLHVVLLLAMVGTSGCAKDSVMAPRQALPPVPDNPTPAAPMAPAAPAAPTTPVVAAPKTDVAALPKLDLGKLPTGPAKASVSGPASGSYKVTSGDTLGGIAHRYGVKTADLAAYNGLTLKSVLRIGQTLQIPPGGKLKAGSSAKKSTATVAKSSATGVKSSGGASAAVASAATGAGGTYVVVKGDFPAKIAKKNNVSTSDLLAANKLTEKSVLQIGQKLVIPGKGAAATATPAAGGATTTTPSVEDLNDVLSDLPVTTPAPATGATGATGTPAAVTPSTATPGVTTAPAAATPATGATGTPAAVTPVTPPAAPANANVELDPIMVDRDLPLKDFAARYGVTEDVVRRYNPNVIPADNILKYQTIIMLPQVSN